MECHLKSPVLSGPRGAVGSRTEIGEKIGCGGGPRQLRQKQQRRGRGAIAQLRVHPCTQDSNIRNVRIDAGQRNQQATFSGLLISGQSPMDLSAGEPSLGKETKDCAISLKSQVPLILTRRVGRGPAARAAGRRAPPRAARPVQQHRPRMAKATPSDAHLPGLPWRQVIIYIYIYIYIYKQVIIIYIYNITCCRRRAVKGAAFTQSHRPGAPEPRSLVRTV